MRLFLVRHGRTALNAAGVLRGENDVALDDVGLSEVALLREAFSEVAFDLVVSSPLKRARQTAVEVAKGSGTIVTIDARLRDRSYGSFAGQALIDVERRYGSINLAPGVEPLEEMEKRSGDAVEEALARGDEPGATTALVSHDVILRSLLARLLPSSSSQRLYLPTASWSELRREEGDHSFEAISIAKVAEPGVVIPSS